MIRCPDCRGSGFMKLLMSNGQCLGSGICGRCNGEGVIGNMTTHDWMQIEQAASGCIGGTSDEWPALRVAIEKITNKPLGDRKPASWLQGFCEGLLVQYPHGRDFSV